MSRRDRRAATAAALLLLAACSDGAVPAPSERNRWALVPVATIQPAEGSDGELIAPNDLAFARDGSLLVADARPATVKVFGPDGAFRARIGRQGKGPGEFEHAWIAVVGETLVVQDPENAKLAVFDWRSGAFLRERRSTCCVWFPIGLDTVGGRALLRALPSPDSAGWRVQRFERVSLSAEERDTLVVHAGASVPQPPEWRIGGAGAVMTLPVPMHPVTHFAVSRSGRVVVGWGGEYRLRSTRDGRDTVHLFGREPVELPVSAGHRAAALDRVVAFLRSSLPTAGDDASLRSMLDPALFPDAQPAFEGLWVDDRERVWVRTPTADTARIAFDVFDREGTWQAAVDVARRDWSGDAWAPVASRRGRYAVILEDEDGRPLVRVLELIEARSRIER